MSFTRARRLLVMVIICFIFILVFGVVTFRLTASQVKSTCQPTTTVESVYSKIDQFSTDLSPFQELRLSTDELTVLLHQSLPSTTCVQIAANQLVIIIPGDWLAYQLQITTVNGEPFIRFQRLKVNGLTMPASIQERYNLQLQQAWRDYTYDWTDGRRLTGITFHEDYVVITGELSTPL